MHLSPRVRIVLVIVAVAVVAGGIIAGVALTGNPAPSPTLSPSASPSPEPTATVSPTPTKSPTPSPTPSASPVAVCPYTGEQLSDPSVLDRPAILVQVENNPVGRPTSGLNAADMVIEAPVEGDTTRFGPVYLCGEAPARIGPVRSARYYDVDLWRQLHEITFHFGAASKVLSEFRSTGMPYVNGIEGVWPFFSRRGGKPAPHNVYFDLEQAREMVAQGAFGDRVQRAGDPRAVFTFDPDAELPSGRSVGSVTIHTNSFWSFGWSWDGGGGHWLRLDSGAPAVDALSGDRLSADAVIVQRVTETVLPTELDPGGYPRRRQHMVGTGTGILYADGKAFDVRWSRPADDAVTSWTYADSGDPVVLTPGRVWWEIVPIGSSVAER
jgi:hypothetical protein